LKDREQREQPIVPGGAAPSLAGAYPALASLAGATGQGLDAALAPPMAVPAGTVLFDDGAACQGFPLVLDGEIKVSRHSEDGRQIELYRVVPGDLCLVSSASLFRNQPLRARGVTTRPTLLQMISPAAFSDWLAHPAFRAEVLGMFADRMADLTAMVDAVAFQRLDQRLAAALLGHGDVLPITHQALADQLGTVREIVTRLLRQFEREGWVVLSRGRIQIANSAALRARAQGL
jgi:CRP/FNR family transcriptional regulator